MADEPLTDERLAEIRARATVSWQMLENSDTISVEVALTRDSLALLAEIDRLRTREAALRSHLPRFLYPFESPFTCDPCPWCHCSQDYEPHVPDCPITLARALLAQE